MSCASQLCWLRAPFQTAGWKVAQAQPSASEVLELMDNSPRLPPLKTILRCVLHDSLEDSGESQPPRAHSYDLLIVFHGPSPFLVSMKKTLPAMSGDKNKETKDVAAIPLQPPPWHRNSHQPLQPPPRCTLRKLKMRKPQSTGPET